MTALDPSSGGLTKAEPIEVGWYAYSGGRQVMIFHLRETGQWSAHFDNGSGSDCAWGYIEQALGVWDLVRIELPPASPVLHPPDTLRRLVEQWGPESIYDAFVTRWPQGDSLLADHVAAARRDALLEAADCVKEARRHGYVGGVPSDPTDVRTEAWLRSLASAALDPVTPTEAGEGTP